MKNGNEKRIDTDVAAAAAGRAGASAFDATFAQVVVETWAAAEITEAAAAAAPASAATVSISCSSSFLFEFLIFIF